MFENPEEHIDFRPRNQGKWIDYTKQLISEFVDDIDDLPDSKEKRRMKEKWEEKLK